MKKTDVVDPQKVYLALRSGAPKNSGSRARFVCGAIKARLVSKFCHGGIVVDGNLLHATSAKGLHQVNRGDWTPSRWDLYELDATPGERQRILSTFSAHEGAKYDWFSLLAFVGLFVRDSSRFYCFEWCSFAITGRSPRKRVTPERCLLEVIEVAGR